MEESCCICFSAWNLFGFDTVLCDDKTCEDVFYYCTQLERDVNSTTIKICASCKDELQNAYNFIDKAKIAWLRMHDESKDDVLEDFDVEILEEEFEIKSEADEEEANNNLRNNTSIDDSCQDELYLERMYNNEIQTDIQKDMNMNSDIVSDFHEKQLSNKETKARQIKRSKKSSNTLTCSECSRAFKRKKNLTKHQKIHQNNQEKKVAAALNNADNENNASINYVCEFCGKLLSTSSSKARHISKMHKNLMGFLCEKCPRTFKDAYGLRKHRTIHQANRARKYACKFCGMKFHTSSTCRSHEDTHNVKREKKYKCDQCEKAFYAMGALNVHKRKHTGQTVQCEICEKRYTRLIDVQIHMRIHTNDRPFECEKCEKKFFHKSALNAHIKKEHLGFKHQCYICCKLFKDRDSLQEHKAEHTTFPFVCTICNKSYAKGHMLNRHMRRVHGIKEGTDKKQHTEVIIP